MKVISLMGIIASFCFIATGCSRDASIGAVPTPSIERVSLDGADIATAFGWEIYKFRVTAPSEWESVRFWVEEYLSSNLEPVVHELYQSSSKHYGPEDVLVKSLLMKIPSFDSPECSFFINGTGNKRIQHGLSFDSYSHRMMQVINKMEIRLATPIILAVTAYDGSHLSFGNNDLQRYIDHTIQEGEYGRMLVYKVSFQTKEKDDTE